MSKFAELPDGTKLEFPDDTEDGVIDNVVKKHLGVSANPIGDIGQALIDKGKKFLFGDTTPDTTQQNSSLVDKIPGIGPAAPLPQKSTGLVDKAIGAGDAALAQAAQLAGFPIGWVAALGQGGANAITNAVTGSKYNTSPPDLLNEYMSGMYQPKTESGKEQNDWVNENIMRHAMAVLPHGHEMAIPGVTKQLRKQNEAIIRDANKAAIADLIQKQRAQEATNLNPVPGVPPEQPVMGPSNVMPEGTLPDLAGILSREGLLPEQPMPTGETPLPFVPELANGEAPTLPGKGIKKFTPTQTEAERVAAEAAAKYENLGKAMRWRKHGDELIQPDLVLPPETSIDAGLPFSRENKLAAPVELATHEKGVQQGIRDVNELTAERAAMGVDMSGKQAVGPEGELAAKGLDFDLGNAKQRTQGALESALDVGRELAQLQVLVQGESSPRMPSHKINIGGFGNKQRGALDPKVFLEGMNKFNEALSKLTDKLAPIMDIKSFPNLNRNPDGTPRVLVHGTLGTAYDPRNINRRGDLGIHLGTSATSPNIITQRGPAANELKVITPNTETQFFAGRGEKLRQKAVEMEKEGQPVDQVSKDLYNDRRSLPYVLDSNKIVRVHEEPFGGAWEKVTTVKDLLLKEGIITPEESMHWAKVVQNIGEEKAMSQFSNWLKGKGIDAIEYPNAHERITTVDQRPGSIVVLNKEKLRPVTDVVKSVMDRQQKLGQTVSGKGQKGSIGFFGKDAFENFTNQVREAVPDATPEEILQLWKKKQQLNVLETKEAKAKKIYGNPLDKRHITVDKVNFSDIPVEKVIEDLVNTADSAKPENFYESHLMSSGYMRAEAANNPAVAQAIRFLKGMVDKNKNRAENALYRQENSAYGHESGIAHDLTKLEKLFSPGDAWGWMKQMFEAKDKPDATFNFNSRQQALHNKWTALSKKMLEEVNQYRPKDNQIAELPNYIPSVHTGRYYVEVAKRLPDGTLSKPVLWGFENKHYANVRSKLLAMDNSIQVSPVKDRGVSDIHYRDSRENRAANYQYMLDLLGDKNPVVAQLGKELMDSMQGTAFVTKGKHQHLKEYQGFKGELGNNPYKTDRQNYYQGKAMLEEYVKSHYDWVAAQEGAKFIDSLVKQGDKIGKNDFNILENYVNDSVLGNRMQSSFDNFITDAGNAITGSSANQQKAIAGTIGNILTATKTSMGSPVHVVQNVVQPLTVMMPHMLAEGMHPVAMMKALTKGMAEYAYLFLGKQTGEIGKLFGADAINILGTKNFNEKMNFAERAGIITPTIVDTKSMFGNKAANRVSQFTMQGFLSKPSEQAARWTVFSQMADYYRDVGMGKEQAFNKAREVTENYMVDYGADAKANIWKDAGFIGNLAGRLQSYATSNFSQTYVYSKKAMRGDPNAKLALVGYLGTLAALGGIAGIPLADAVMGTIDWLLSQDGKTFSSANYLRKTVGNEAVEGAWGKLGLGLAPSFGSRSINNDNAVPLPAFVGLPAFGNVPEAIRAGGRRAFGKNTWEQETNAEKGRELTSIAPTVLMPWVEDAYLKEQVGQKEHRVSGKTGNVVHTTAPDETSFGNIRSAERARDTSISNEQYHMETRYQEQRKTAEKELKGLTKDIFVYGNDNAQKHLRFVRDYNKYVKEYGGDPAVAQKVLDDIRPYVSDGYMAQFLEVAKKPNINLEDVRKLRQYKESSRLYNAK